MPWSGSGSFTRNNGTYTGSTVWAQDKAAGTKITSANHDTHDQDLASGINACLTKNGENTPTANLPMGNYVHTGVGAASARTHYARASQVQDSTLTYGGTAGGTADALTISLSPAITAYVAGQRYTFFVGASPNTGAATLNINGVAAAAIVDTAGNALAGGELRAGMLAEVVYDGTSFVLQSVPDTIQSSTVLALSSAASSEVRLQVGGTTYWKISTSYHFLPNTANSYDIGGSGAEVRAVYATNLWSDAGADLNLGVGGANAWHIDASTSAFYGDSSSYDIGKSGTKVNSIYFTKLNGATAPTYTVTGGSTDRALDASSPTLADTTNVLGTLIADLQTAGVLV